MMGKNLKLPVGVDDFKKIRHDKFYYIDKTKLLEQLLEQLGRSKSFHQTKTIWKNFKYEYAALFF